MEDSVRQRIKEVLRYKNVSMTSFSNGNSALQLRLSRQLNRNVSISLDTVLIILDRYPEISAEWLIRGRGEMLEEENARNTIIGIEADYVELQSKYMMLKDLYNEACAEIAALKKK